MGEREWTEVSEWREGDKRNVNKAKNMQIGKKKQKDQEMEE